MARIGLGKATKVLPPLQYVVDKLSVKRPLFSYEAHRFSDVSNDVGGVDVTVSGIRVVCDAETVGVIDYRWGEGRATGGSKTDAILIQSTHIKKERGHRSGMMTTDADKAVKLAVKHFAPPELGKTCEELVWEVQDRLDGALYSARNSLEKIVSYNQQDMRKYWIERELKGADIPVPTTLTIHKDLLHLYEKYLAGAQIQDAVHDKANAKGYAVQELEDRSIRVVPIRYKRSQSYEVNKQNGIELVRYRTFDDMPIDLQNKISMLRIAEKDEVYQDIGVRLSQNNGLMYIME